jgi:hypothetical protein
VLSEGVDCRIMPVGGGSNDGGCGCDAVGRCLKVGVMSPTVSFVLASVDGTRQSDGFVHRYFAVWKQSGDVIACVDTHAAS